MRDTIFIQDCNPCSTGPTLNTPFFLLVSMLKECALSLFFCFPTEAFESGQLHLIRFMFKHSSSLHGKLWHDNNHCFTLFKRIKPAQFNFWLNMDALIMEFLEMLMSNWQIIKL